MFTGIVQGTAPVLRIVEKDQARSLRIGLGAAHMQGLQRGASVAINGTCLTVTEFDVSVGWVDFDVIAETLVLTNLAKLTVGSLVNFERSLKFGDEIGGHLVSGHIQGMAQVVSVTESLENLTLQCRFSDSLARYILPKGFIAVDGCSLTVGDVSEQQFSLHLIPETRGVTTLGTIQVGQWVNIEVDQQTVTIVNTVERYLAKQKPE